VVAILLFASTAAVYAPVRTHGFAGLDVEEYLTENDLVRRGLSAEGVRWAFTTRHAANWHPVTWLSHMLDVELFGLAPGPHLLVSAALHAGTALLLLAVLLAMTGSLWPSAFVAATFALHPLHVESVAWVVERKDVLSALCWVLAMGAYLGHARRRWRLGLPAAIAFHAAGLMAKPAGVTLPFALLLLDVWPLGRLFPAPRAAAGGVRWNQAPALLAEKAPLFLLSLASVFATLWAQSGLAVYRIPLGSRLANALTSWLSYIIKAVWPASLAAFYPHPWSTGTGIPAWKAALALLLIAAVTGGALLLARRAPFLAVGWLWFLGTLVPMLGFVQVGGQAMADRYTYIPLIGLAVAVAWTGAAIVRRRPALELPAGALGLVALAALSAAARAQVGTWRSTEAVFEHALAVTERNWMAHDIVGRTLQLRGKAAEALPHFEEALRISPRLPPTRYRLGLALLELGRPEEALAQLRETVRIAPSYSPARYTLGMLAAQTGRWEEAREQCRALTALGVPQAEQILSLIPPGERRAASPPARVGR
jgi:tetratricopeptide (TPR) repeat protein